MTSGVTFFGYAASQTIGRRENQEDRHAFLVLNPPEGGLTDGLELLAVVADGMGGHAAGEVASQLAIEAYTAAYRAADAGPTGSVSRRLHALDAANGALQNQIAANPRLDGMGCTLLAASFTTDGVSWLSVGDSLLYIYSGTGPLERLNDDHSMAPVLDRMASQGLIGAQEAQTSPERHHLLSALTGGPIAERDAPEGRRLLKPGDWVILASDGIETLSRGTIEKVIARHAHDAGQLVQGLLREVEKCGEPYQDNTTVMAVQARVVEGVDTGSGSLVMPTRPVSAMRKRRRG